VEDLDSVVGLAFQVHLDLVVDLVFQEYQEYQDFRVLVDFPVY
jgi:hypothetical protein